MTNSLNRFQNPFKNALAYLECPEDFEDIRKKIPNKFLFYGKSGTGKSYLAKCIHKEFQLPSIKVKSDVFQQKFFGETGKSFTEFFDIRDPQKRPLILFIDEFDTIASERKSEHEDDIHGTNRATVNSLLFELDRQEGDPSVFTFVATNHRDVLDEAILSRFRGIEIIPMDYAAKKIYVQNKLKHFVVEDRQKTIGLFFKCYHIVAFAFSKTKPDLITSKILKETKNLSRRGIKKALEDAVVLTRRSQRLTKHNKIISIDNLILCIREEQKNHGISCSTQINRFVKDSQPYLACANTLMGAGNIGLVQYNHQQDKAARAEEQKFQRNWAKEERDFNRGQAALQQTVHVAQLGSFAFQLYGALSAPAVAMFKAVAGMFNG